MCRNPTQLHLKRTSVETLISSCENGENTEATVPRHTVQRVRSECGQRGAWHSGPTSIGHVPPVGHGPLAFVYDTGSPSHPNIPPVDARLSRDPLHATLTCSFTRHQPQTSTEPLMQGNALKRDTH